MLIWVILVAILPILLALVAEDLKVWLLRLARKIATSGSEPGSDLPPEVAAVDGQPIAMLYRALKVRGDAWDPDVPKPLRLFTAATRSSDRVARLWLPTAVGASALTLEIPALLLVAAHVDDGGVTLTGLALALAIIVAINAGPLALTTTTASSRKRNWPRQSVWTYTLGVGGASMLLLALVWTDPLGNPLGFSDATWGAARDVLRGLAFAPLLVALRRHLHGYLILAEKTGWVIWATLARTMTSVLLATLLAVVLDVGATSIGWALTAGVAIEAGIVGVGASGRGTGIGGPGHARDLPAIARIHLPLSWSTLLAVVPAAAILGGLALSDGSYDALWAWLLLAIGPSLIASLTLDIEAITAAMGEQPADSEEPDGSTKAFALILGAVLTVLWLVLAKDAGIDATVTWWLLPFPLLCVAREWLRGTLIALDRAARTIPAVAAGSLTLLSAFVACRATGLEAVLCVAVAVSVGAAAETLALALWSHRAGADAQEIDPPPGRLRQPVG